MTNGAPPTMPPVNASVDAAPATIRSRLVSEFVGTFAILLAAFVVIAARGRGLSDAISTEVGRFGTVAIVLFAIMTVFDATSSHFNPAISFAHAVSKRMPWRDCGIYILVQTVASLFAAIAASLFVGGRTRRVLPNAARVSSGRALVLEFVASLCLVAIYLGTERRLRNLRPMLVAIAMGAGALTIGRFTTVGMNPARSLGAAIWGGFGSTTWLFLIAPLLAGVIVGFGARIATKVPLSIWVLLLSEFLGSFLALFLGFAGLRTTGFVVGQFIYVVGPPVALFICALITGSRTYFNPAIGLALVVARRLSPGEGTKLVLPQLAGAVAAVVALRAWLPGSMVAAVEIEPMLRITMPRLFVLECLAAMVVMLVVLRRDHPILGPVGVASATLAMTLSIASFGRSHLNPAYAVAALVGGSGSTELRNLVWIIGGPFVGMLIVAAIYRWVERKPAQSLPIG